MTVFIALLRGVNVGGAGTLPMADLRAAMTGAGFDNVRTYVQSGNIILESAGPTETVRKTLEAVIAARFVFETMAVVVSLPELDAAIEANPFALEASEPTHVHLGFMTGNPDEDAVEALRGKPQGEDAWRISGRYFYLHTPVGMGKSRLAPFIERTLKTPVTFRNWRTVLTLAEMARA